MKTYQNRKEVNLMVWEVDPKMRKQNNIVKANVSVNTTLNQNDNINYQGKFLVKVDQILETKPAALKGYTNVTFKASFVNL